MNGTARLDGDGGGPQAQEGLPLGASPVAGLNERHELSHSPCPRTLRTVHALSEAGSRSTSCASRDRIGSAAAKLVSFLPADADEQVKR